MISLQAVARKVYSITFDVTSGVVGPVITWWYAESILQQCRIRDLERKLTSLGQPLYSSHVATNKR